MNNYNNSSNSNGGSYNRNNEPTAFMVKKDAKNGGASYWQGIADTGKGLLRLRMFENNKGGKSDFVVKIAKIERRQTPRNNW